MVHSEPAEPEVRRIGPATLVLQDALAGMRELPDELFDLAIADPPYGASTHAKWALAEDHSLPGFGGSWRLAAHEWDRLNGSEALRFTLAWLAQLKRLVKPSGSIWIHGTYHNIGMANVACQILGLEIINEVVWLKRNAFPNLSGRRLTASHETILWVHTGGERRQYRFNYDAAKMAAFDGDQLKEPGKQLRTVWDIPNNKSASELRFGRFPAQKPLRLTERLLLLTGVEGGALLVPFLGSGTEAVAALRWGMRPTGFETDPHAFGIASQRVESEVSQLKLRTGP